MKKYILVISALFLFFSACKKSEVTGTTSNSHPNATKIAPEGFNFATTKQISFTIKLQTNFNKPISGVVVKLLNAGIEANYNMDSDSGRTFLFKGVSDANGMVQGQVYVDKNTDTLLIDPGYIGLARNVKAYLNNNSTNVVIGGTGNLSGDVVGYNLSAHNHAAQTASIRTLSNLSRNTFGTAVPWTAPNIQFYGGASSINWNSIGVPNYLYPVSDEITAALLAGINASVPENGHLPNEHPEYLAGTVPTDLAITADADVYIGFAYAGTSQQSTFGYYFYPTNNPPTQPGQIGNMYLLFPNADDPSYHNNQVVLAPGNKVHIGTVKAGTSIGFFLIPGGWENGSTTSAGHTINTSGYIYYSNPLFNPENNPSNSNPSPIRHSVILNDPTFSQFIIGFEDSYAPNQLPNNSGNNDYNDCVAYITSTPISSINSTGVPPIDSNVDTDGDGVPDAYDAFPTDPTRAYINYYPSSNTYGYVAYEDNFPQKGDYDMNDLVVQYQYEIISNAQNNIVEFYANYSPVAAGAVYKNGFGVQFPFASSLVSKVTGEQLKNNYITLAANGTEAKQTNAVIIPFDSYTDLINNSNGADYINTKSSLPFVTGNTANIYMSFTSPLTPAQFGNPPFDMFAISNMRRGYEIHLPNNAPTALANMSLFGTQDDGSVPSQGIYYVSYDNWPWAMNFTQPFSYPLEGENVSQAYLHFLDWAGSGGTLFTDWYSNTGSGYRNNSNIYSH